MEVEEDVGEVCNQTPEKQLESAITVYLRKVYSHQDVSPIITVILYYYTYVLLYKSCRDLSHMQLLKSQLDAKYFNHPVYAEVKSLLPFIGYMEECVKVAWGLCIQTPHMTISCKDTVYSPDIHKRFYNADKSRENIIMYMWPVLAQFNGPVLVRGIVLT